MRELFGPEADKMRLQGWSLMNLGPRSIAVIDRFIIKLGKALCYRYNKKLFDGVIYARHINVHSESNLPDLLPEILSKALLLSNPPGDLRDRALIATSPIPSCASGRR